MYNRTVHEHCKTVKNYVSHIASVSFTVVLIPNLVCIRLIIYCAAEAQKPMVKKEKF